MTSIPGRVVLIVAVFGTEDGDVETGNAGVRKSRWMLVVATLDGIAKQLIGGFEIRVQNLNTKRCL